jgi:predicted negative regulator of RcsB-dependent stress response
LWLVASLWLCALAATNASIASFWRDSVALFSWTVTARPDSHYALENLALAHQTAGNHAQAIAVEQRIPAAERSFQGRLVLARATRESGDFATAVALYQATLAVPANDEAMEFGAVYELALAYRQLGDERASAAQAALAETLAEKYRISARLREYYRRELARLR